MNSILLLAVLASPSETKVFPAGIKHVEVLNGSGDIRFEGGPSDGVEVIATKKDFDEKECAVSIVQEKDTVRVEAKKTSTLFGGPCEVSFQITAPAAVSLQTTTGSGNLRVRGAAGSVSFTTGSGDVTIAGDPKSVEGRTGSGDVKVVYKHPPAAGSIDLRTGSGDSTVVLPESTAYAVHFRAGSGNLQKAFADTKEAKFTIAAKTGSGDLRIEKAKD